VPPGPAGNTNSPSGRAGGSGAIFAAKIAPGRALPGHRSPTSFVPLAGDETLGAKGGEVTRTVTGLLAQASRGDRAAFDRLFPLVYEELRELAGAHRRRWEGDATLNTTALVHEAYLRLVDRSSAGWKDRAHFLAVASRAMRHILIDRARARQAQKRGGDRGRLSLEEIEHALDHDSDPSDARDEALLALADALARLERENPREAQIVECRFFGAMTIRETAEALEVSTSTVNRGWAAAQVRLYRELRETLGGHA
jgi:RNA polymerase sigma factor (TIGR02999 family)